MRSSLTFSNVSGRIPAVAVRSRLWQQESLLLIGAVGAAAITFRHWGIATPLVVSGVTLAFGAGRRGSLSLAAMSAAAAGFVHFAVAPEHFAEWWGFGTFFVLCGEAQLGWALLVRRAPGRPALAVGSVGSLLLIALWAASRTSGLPFGPDPGVREAVGTTDLLAIALEIFTAASCAWALAARRPTALH